MAVALAGTTAHTLVNLEGVVLPCPESGHQRTTPCESKEVRALVPDLSADGPDSGALSRTLAALRAVNGNLVPYIDIESAFTSRRGASVGLSHADSPGNERDTAARKGDRRHCRSGASPSLPQAAGPQPA